MYLRGAEQKERVVWCVRTRREGRVRNGELLSSMSMATMTYIRALNRLIGLFDQIERSV